MDTAHYLDGRFNTLGIAYMFLNYASFDGRTISLTTGTGPALLGHYMSSAEWRVVSAILASVASSIPQVLIGVVSTGRSDEDVEKLIQPCSSVEWRRLSLDDVRDGDRGGVVVSERGSVLFFPSNRDEIEDCVYRSFARNECFVTPVECLRSAQSIIELEDAIRDEAVVNVVGRYFDIDVVILDATVRDTVVDRVARVVSSFNQF